MNNERRSRRWFIRTLQVHKNVVTKNAHISRVHAVHLQSVQQMESGSESSSSCESDEEDISNDREEIETAAEVHDASDLQCQV